MAVAVRQGRPLVSHQPKPLVGSRDSLSKCTYSTSSHTLQPPARRAFLPLCAIIPGSSGDNRQGAYITYPASTQAIVVYILVGKIAFGGYTASFQVEPQLPVNDTEGNRAPLLHHHHPLCLHE